VKCHQEREGLAFFHALSGYKFRLHPFSLQNEMYSVMLNPKGGTKSVILNILHVPLVLSRIKDAGKIEGIIHSLIIFLVGSITLKMTILLYLFVPNSFKSSTALFNGSSPLAVNPCDEKLTKGTLLACAGGFLFLIIHRILVNFASC